MKEQLGHINFIPFVIASGEASVINYNMHFKWSFSYYYNRLAQGRTVFNFFLIFFYFCPFPNKTGYIIHVYKSSINITPNQSRQFISGNLSDLKVTRIIQSLYHSPASRCIHPAKVPIEGAVLFKLILKVIFFWLVF